MATGTGRVISVNVGTVRRSIEEVMRGLDDLVRQGKVLYAGISDAPAWWIARSNTLAELRGSPLQAFRLSAPPERVEWYPRLSPN